jgi:hypothetical protein
MAGRELAGEARAGREVLGGLDGFCQIDYMLVINYGWN